jgi:hypothetical protein
LNIFHNSPPSIIQEILETPAEEEKKSIYYKKMKKLIYKYKKGWKQKGSGVSLNHVQLAQSKKKEQKKTKDNRYIYIAI